MSRFYSDLVLDKSLIKSTGSNRVYIDNGDLYRSDSDSVIHHINDVSDVTIFDIDRSADRALNWKTLKALLLLMYRNNPLIETKLTQKYTLKRLIEGIISYNQDKLIKTPIVSRNIQYDELNSQYDESQLNYSDMEYSSEDQLKPAIYDNQVGVALHKTYKDESELLYDIDPSEVQDLLEITYDTRDSSNFLGMKYYRYEYKDIMKDLLVSIIIDSPCQIKYDQMPGNILLQDMRYSFDESAYANLNGSDYYKAVEMRYGKRSLSVLYDKEVRQIINEAYDRIDRNNLLIKNIDILNKYDKINIPNINFRYHSVGLTPRFNISDYVRFYKIRGGKVTRKYKDIKDLIYKFKPLNFKGNNGQILSIKYVNEIDTGREVTPWFNSSKDLMNTEYANTNTEQKEYLGKPEKSYYNSKNLKYSENSILMIDSEGNIKPIIYTKSKVTYNDTINKTIDATYDVFMDKSQTQYETYHQGKLRAKYLRDEAEKASQMYKNMRRIHYAKPIPTDHDIQYRTVEYTDIYTEEIVIPKGAILDLKIEYRLKSHDNAIAYYKQPYKLIKDYVRPRYAKYGHNNILYANVDGSSRDLVYTKVNTSYGEGDYNDLKYDGKTIHYNKFVKDCIIRTIVVDDSSVKISKEGIDLFHVVIDEKRLNIYSINQDISEFNIQYCKYYFTL